MKLALLAGSLIVFAIAAQSPIPPPLARDFDRLSSAGTVKVDVKIRLVGEAPDEYQISLAKPNLYRVQGPTGFILSNGTTLYTYNKAKNTYFERPVLDSDLAELLKRPELFGWAPFFEKEPATRVALARQTGTRTVEGTTATEVEVSMKQEGVHGTLFLEQRNGVAKGYLLSAGGKDYLALASQVVVGADAAAAGEYAFTAPDGATKTEAPKPDEATFAEVQAIMTASCMPCHSANEHSGNTDLSSYAGVSRSVSPGNGAGSRLVTVLKTPGPGRMPQGRAPLPQETITKIQKWIDAGAKNN